MTLRRGWDRRAIVIGSGRDLPPRGKICPRRCRTHALAGVCTSDEILDAPLTIRVPWPKKEFSSQEIKAFLP